MVAPTQDLRKRANVPEESEMDEEEEEERESDEQEAAESGRQLRKSLPRGVAAKYENPSVFLQFKLDVKLSPHAQTSLCLIKFATMLKFTS